MGFDYDYEKNAKLISERGIGFEEIITAISSGNILDIRRHPNKEKYPNQHIYYVRILEEVYQVLCVLKKDGSIFLKTLFPSIRARKEFMKK